MIHAYFNVDYNLVWDTVVEDVPILESRIEILVNMLKNS